MNVDDERRLRRNWSFLKQELVLEDFLYRFVEQGVFTHAQRDEILNVMPNTKSMRMEKFLQAVLMTGDRGYQCLCNLLRENTDNRYSRVIDRLEISTVIINHDGLPPDSRPSTGLSSASSTVSSRDGETGERNVRRKVKRDENGFPYESPNSTQVATVAPVVAVMPERHTYPPPRGASNQRRPSDEELGPPRVDNNTPLFVPSPRMPASVHAATQQQNSQQQQAQITQPEPLVLENGHQQDMVLEASGDHGNTEAPQAPSDAAQSASSTRMNNVDMRALEQELVRMAPTIAELFQKINKQTSNVPNSEQELQRVKEENERLRKTNKSLIEKLNTFQQKIIQLQLENRKLKDNGDSKKIKKEELEQKANDLKDMERRLEEHKNALEQKEQELNEQLCKLKEIEEENAEQKEKIDKLEELQDEGVQERNIQQEQISVLVEEKERQREQIETLEERQKIGDQRMFRLEERLKMLEQVGKKPVGRRGGGARVVSPPGRTTWMSGHIDRSHHANVKFNSEIKFNPEGKTSTPPSRKPWPFNN